MVKFKNLAINAKHATLFSVITLIFAACQSNEQKLAELNTELNRIESEITKAYTDNHATDSAERNPALKDMNMRIEKNYPGIVGLNNRNWEISDSISAIQIQRIAAKYPLRKFLSKNAINQIREQLRTHRQYYAEPSVQRIIDGRGTLMDLYNVSFYLNFEESDAPFRIINPVGAVRFGDPKRDAMCKKFDDEKLAIENANYNNANNKEFQKNKKEIQEFSRMCAVRDSIYSEIESYFRPRMRNHIDSLKIARVKIYRQREELIQNMTGHDK